MLKLLGMDSNDNESYLTHGSILSKTSFPKRKKIEGKKLHLPLSTLCEKNSHRNENKYMNKGIKKVIINLFCYV